MGVRSYNYEYFCGANVTIELNGGRQMDVAGISYQLSDSSTPIFGYASRVFDAVAPGQKMVRGTFVVNFTEFNAIAKSIMKTKLNTSKDMKKFTDKEYLGAGQVGSEQRDKIYQKHVSFIEENFLGEDKKIKEGERDNFIAYVQRVMYSNTYGTHDAVSMGQDLLEDYSLTTDSAKIKSTGIGGRSTLNALMSGPFNIKIIFGDPDVNKNFMNYFEIVQCYVNTISGTIQISEDVILQEFSFFGRDIISN